MVGISEPHSRFTQAVQPPVANALPPSSTHVVGMRKQAGSEMAKAGTRLSIFGVRYNLDLSSTALPRRRWHGPVEPPFSPRGWLNRPTNPSLIH